MHIPKVKSLHLSDHFNILLTRASSVSNKRPNNTSRDGGINPGFNALSKLTKNGFSTIQNNTPQQINIIVSACSISF